VVRAERALLAVLGDELLLGIMARMVSSSM
jgi:hypothetical protein